MTEIQSQSTELKAHYATQVAADLERNTEAQERIGAELAALQEQLLGLQRDRALLESMRHALGADSPAAAEPTEPPAEAATAPVPRQTRKKHSPSPKAKKPAANAPSKKTNTTAKAAGQPTLGELIRSHLAEQPEPRSAAEITGALSQSHPDRNIKATVVRTTVEQQVAKGHVERSKQGSSVFYSTTAGHSHPTEPIAPEQADAAS